LLEDRGNIGKVVVSIPAEYRFDAERMISDRGLERDAVPQNTTRQKLLAPQENRDAVEKIGAAAPAPRFDVRAVRCIKPSRNPTARLVIFFCFGFGEASYQWVTTLPSEIEVWTVGTTDISNWDQLTAYFAKHLRGLFDVPVVAWGHSMGSHVAFEVLTHLEQVDGLVAKAAIVSSAGAPVFFERTKYRTPFHEIDAAMSDSEIEQRLADNHFIIARSAGIPLISATGLRNDVELIRSYRYDKNKRIQAPLVLVHADNDVVVRDAAVILEWGRTAMQRCRYEEIEGTHLFFMQPPKRFVELLIGVCSDTAALQSDKQRHFSEHPQASFERPPPESDSAVVDMVGCWTLRSVDGQADELPTNDCKGRCVVTEDGFVSMLIDTADHPAFAFRDAAAATQEELQPTLATVISWTGRLETSDAGLTATTLVWQAPAEGDSKQVSVEKSGDNLKISWRDARTADTSAMIHSEWSRNTKLR